MKYRQFGQSGLRFSILGMGGSGFGNVYEDFDEVKSTKAVQYAVDKGINFFDTAYWYGQGKSESFLGRALRSISRSKFFLATKVGRYERDVANMFDFSVHKTMQSAKESLKRLQVDYIDLLQIHDVEFAPSVDLVVNETLPAIEELQSAGICRFIGITGYSLPVLLDVVQRSKVKIDSVLTYCRLTLNDSTLLDYVADFQSLGVQLINASPVSMGLLTPSQRIQSWHPATEEIKKACVGAAQYCEEMDVDITRLAVHYSTNFSQV